MGDEVAALRAALAEAQLEVERSHFALDDVYEHLAVLEKSLAYEQVLLCPIDLCKWWKTPEWEQRYEYAQTEEGKRGREKQIEARRQLHDEWRTKQRKELDDG